MASHVSFPIIIWALLLLMSRGSAEGYDAPDFDYQILEADALHITQDERDGVVELLNAMACNFPTSPLIDEDLKEKALALAISLDPLNVNSRNAHFSLLAGRPPAKTAYFQTSVSEVSEKLWIEAGKMSGKNAQPQTRQLARYMEELSLVLHPDPPLDRVKHYARVSDGELRPWSRFLKLHPETNPSGAKIKSLLETAKTNRVDAVPQPKRPVVFSEPRMEASRSAEPGRKRADSPGEMRASALEVKLANLKIPFVSHIQGAVRSGTLGGFASIDIRKATAAEEGLFGMAPGTEAVRANQMRLLSHPEGFQASGFELAEQFLRRTHPEWPEKLVAEFRFASDLPFQSSRRIARVNASLAASLLLTGVFTGQKIAPALSFAGFIAEPLGSGEPLISLGDEVKDVLDQAKALKAEFLLVPDSSYDSLVKEAIATRQLEYLFDPQLISFANWEQLKAFAFGGKAAEMASASSEFKKIQGVQDQMSLVDLSKNAKVRERLEQIVAAFPQHLSSRVMLAFGIAPDDLEAIKKAAIREVDEAIAPFLTDVAQAVANDSLDDFRFLEIETSLDASDNALASLQTDIPATVRNYLFQAKELSNQVKSLISNHTDTAISIQRFGEVKKAFSELQLERVTLGLEKIDAKSPIRPRRMP